VLTDPQEVKNLRRALVQADYTGSGINARLGAQAVAAVNRDDFRAALAATADGDRLDTLIRLFICNVEVPATLIEAALHPLTLDRARAAGIIAGNRAGVDLEPYGDEWWVLADLPSSPGQPLPADHVLGIGAASSTLAGATIRHPVRTALDLGTGCGVQAMHLSTHAGSVTATDLSARALLFARANAMLNGLDWELLEGDLLEPVRGRRFDLVVSNPPFIVGPGQATHTYRDSGRAGDGICAELAHAAPELLEENGTIQYLANWMHVQGQDWEDRVAGWFAGTGLDLWAVQREVQDPLDYVRLWIADASERHDPHRMARWLDWMESQRVTGIGFGLITARRSGHTDPTVVCEDLRQQVESPLGERVSEWFARQDWLRTHDLVKARYRLSPGLELRQNATMGPEGWLVDQQLLAMRDGLRWVEEIDPLILALVSGCDGTMTLKDQIDLLAIAHGAPATDLEHALTGVVAHLIERGILVPVLAA
jgi:methylase of polypeptide subunit release factors